MNIPTWQQINALFEKHGMSAPPTRLRDELVAHLLAYREQQPPQPNREGRGDVERDLLPVEAQSEMTKALLAQPDERAAIEEMLVAVEKARGHISGGLCYFTAEAKHAQLQDADRVLAAALTNARDHLSQPSGGEG